MHGSDTGTAQDMLDLTETKITEAQKDIEDLMAMKKTLEELAAECPGGETSTAHDHGDGNVHSH